MIRALAYVGFVSPNSSEWRRFGPEVLGAELMSPDDDDTVRLRIDDAAWRLAIHPGETDDLAYIGWDVGDADGLAAAVDRLARAGFHPTSGDPDLAATRQVTAVVWFTGPFGFRHELTYGQHCASTPFDAGRPMGGGFVTGAGGMGHLVLMVPEFDRANEFFVETLGFSHSDDIDLGIQVRFLHCNERHHTLAFSVVPGMVGVHHLMLEVEEPSDVGGAWDIVIDQQLPIAMSLGRHTNDEMLSFYVRTPSGFEIEYGSGGRLIDTSAPWEAEEYDAMSHWGHRPPAERLFPSILRPVP